jgi:hypothetical protein
MRLCKLNGYCGRYHNLNLTAFANLSRIFPYSFVTCLALSVKVQPAERSEDLSKYRRIEVKAFRHRVDIVSGEWPRDVAKSLLAQTDNGVLVNDSDLCEPVEPDSPEGQQILIEAVRSLERRLSPEARATIRNTSKDPHADPEEFNPATQKGP